MKPRGKPIIWTPEIAYAVGLITTDGNLSPDGRHFTMVSNDIQLLETFKNCLQIKNKIVPKTSGYTQKKSSHKVQFGNVIFYKWLLDIGLMPNKSKRIKSLKIPDNYFFHFLRGHLDGDGHIRRYQDPVYPNSQRIYVNFNSASLNHLKWLRKNIKRTAGLKGFIRAGTKIFILSYAKRESLKILPLIYPDKNVPCLIRKFNIIESFL